MNITISHTDERPMYEQIEEGIKKAIYEGQLENNQQLPSVRQLAKDLNVSAITTKRAYIDLEHEGLIYTVSGKGTFVRLDKIDELHRNREREILERLAEAIKECRKIRVDIKKINQLAEEIYNTEE